MMTVEGLDSGSHQSPITHPVNFLPFNPHPSTAIHQVTEYIHERLLNDHLCAHHRLGVPSKWWERLLCLFNLRVISARCSGQDGIEFTRGVLNCSVVLNGASVRVNPMDEKSVQVYVVRFAAHDCNTVGEH